MTPSMRATAWTTSFSCFFDPPLPDEPCLLRSFALEALPPLPALLLEEAEPADGVVPPLPRFRDDLLLPVPPLPERPCFRRAPGVCDEDEDEAAEGARLRE